MPSQTEVTAPPRDKKISFEQKLKAAAIIVAVLSFVGCSALTAREFITVDQKVRIKAESVKETKRYLPEPAAAPVDPLRLLPATIEGFNTEAYHLVPGQEKFAAEAIYGTTGEDEEEEVSPPHNSYVKITFYENSKDALKVISRNLKIRYPAKKSILLKRDDIEVHAGYEQGYGGYYLAYVTAGYLIEIHTNFLAVVPQERGTLLEDSALAVFNSVSRQVTAVLGR